MKDQYIKIHNVLRKIVGSKWLNGKMHKEPVYEQGNTTAYQPYKRHSLTNQRNMK